MDDTEPRFTARELQGFRSMLLEKLSELVADMRDVQEEVGAITTSHGDDRIPRDAGEASTLGNQEEILRALGEQERRVAAEVLDALEKIDSETYGVCERTGEPISRKRLEAIPWARYSIEAAEEMER